MKHKIQINNLQAEYKAIKKEIDDDVKRVKSLPLVSFLMPTYNRSNLVRQAIDSILSQTYKNIEVIVIDDASTDDTEDVLKKVFGNRVRYYKNNINKGISYSRNLGLRYSTGKYIGLLDSDDILLKSNYVETALKIMEFNPEIYVFTSDAYCIDLKGNKICEKTFFETTIDHRNIRLSSGIKDFDYIFFHGVHSCGAIFRRDISGEIGFLSSDYKITWDEDFFLKVSTYKPGSIYYQNEPSLGYRIHVGNISKNLSTLYLERIKCRQDVLHKNKSIRKRLGNRANKRLAELYLCLIDAYLKEGNGRASVSAIFRSIFLYPLIFQRLFNHGVSISKRILSKGFKG